MQYVGAHYLIHLTVTVGGAVDGEGVGAVAGAGEGEHLDAVVGELQQVLQHRCHRREARYLWHLSGQVRGRGRGSGARRVEDLVALDDAVAQVDLGRVPAHLDRRRGQRHAVHLLRRAVRH